MLRLLDIAHYPMKENTMEIKNQSKVMSYFEIEFHSRENPTNKGSQIVEMVTRLKKYIYIYIFSIPNFNLWQRFLFSSVLGIIIK